MPQGAQSMASAFTSCRMAPFDAAYGALSFRACSLRSEAVKRMAPPRFAAAMRSRANSCASTKGALTFVAITSSHFSRGSVWAGLRHVVPALFTRISTPPSPAEISAHRPGNAAESETSSVKACASFANPVQLVERACEAVR